MNAPKIEPSSVLGDTVRAIEQWSGVTHAQVSALCPPLVGTYPASSGGVGGGRDGGICGD